MRVGAVDIGTNSMRLLISDGQREMKRLVEVTGLGEGVDRTGRLSKVSVERTIEVLSRFGDLMGSKSVERRKAIATSAARDAANREEFFDRAEEVLGTRPILISGDEEARLAWDGAAMGLEIGGGVVVCDIGGGSTELVREDARVSVDIGSVRLTDRILEHRPARAGEMAEARAHVSEALAGVGFEAESVVGIAGTWTSLAAVDLALVEYDAEKVHGHKLERDRLEALVERLTLLSVEETAAIPSLDPKRAPVILAGSVVAAGVLAALGADYATISERDTLDAVVADLLALP